MYAASLLAEPILCYSVTLVGSNVPDMGMAGPFQPGWVSPPPPPPPPAMVILTVARAPVDTNKVRVTFAPGDGATAVPVGVSLAGIGGSLGAEQVNATTIDYEFATTAGATGTLLITADSPIVRNGEGAYVSAGSITYPFP